MIKISGFIQTTRFLKSLLVALILSFFSGSLLYGVSVLFFLTFSFVFNDWVDVSKDAVGHPHRAIPSGKITRTQAFVLAVVLLITGLILAFAFLDQYLLGLLTIYFLSVFYSLVLKPNLPILATPVWSTAIAILFVQPFTDDLHVYIATAIIVYGYEMLLDYRDIEADKQFSRTPTLANLLGKGSFFVAVAALLTGIGILILFLFYSLSG